MEADPEGVAPHRACATPSGSDHSIVRTGGGAFAARLKARGFGLPPAIIFIPFGDMQTCLSTLSLSSLKNDLRDGVLTGV